MPDADNRIRLDQTPVDFDASGSTGELHDEYPKPDTQSRYDFMRSFLIGLLANQASLEEDQSGTDGETGGEPFEKRTGTMWFNKTAMLMKIFNGEAFDTIAKYLGVEVTEDEVTQVVSIQNIIDSIMATLEYVGPRVVWSGFFTTDEINRIPIPEDYQGYAAFTDMRPFVYIEGLLLDPRTTVIRPSNPAYIDIGGSFEAVPQQTYTVILERVTDIKLETIPARG